MRRKTAEQQLLERTLKASLGYVWRKRSQWNDSPVCPVWLQRAAISANEDFDAFLSDRLANADQKLEEAKNFQIVHSQSEDHPQ